MKSSAEIETDAEGQYTKESKDWAYSQLEQRMEKFLGEAISSMNDGTEPDEVPSDEEDIYNPWQRGRLRSALSSSLDFDGHFHDPDQPICPILSAEKNRDDVILDLLQQDLMYLYDPCVIERIWTAYLYGDEKFFGSLGKLFTGYIKSLGPQRKQSTQLLRRFLVELDRHGIAVINPAGAERVIVAEMAPDEAKRVNRTMNGIPYELTVDERAKIIDNERETAFCILKDLITQEPSLNGLIFANYLRDRQNFKSLCDEIFSRNQFKYPRLNAMSAEVLGSRVINKDEAPEI